MQAGLGSSQAGFVFHWQNAMRLLLKQQVKNAPGMH